MAHTSEIEKLEQRYRENPKGRNFAPLADAYRKAGLVDNAIELCQTGLKLHPDYVSAYIVYGRCLVDKMDHTQAQDIFEKVLSLDPENVLALRTLAEISERGNRLDAAVEWLSRLLAADPMNGDAAEALARVKGKAAVAAVPKVLPVSAVAAVTKVPPVPKAAAAAAARTPPAIEIERASPDQPTAVPLEGRPSRDLETFDGMLDFDEVAHRAAKAEGLEVQEDVELKPERIEIEGLATTQYEGSGKFQLDNLPTPPARVPEPEIPADDELIPVDLPLIMPEDLEPMGPSASPARAAPAAPGPPGPPAPPVPPPPPMPPAPLAPQPPRAERASAPLVDDDGAADRAALSQAEPVVTETMAELYLKQGHKEDALRVYRALLAQRPGDARLKARIEALLGRKRASGQSAGAFLKSVLRGAPADSTVPAVQTDETVPTDVSSLVAGAFDQVADDPMLGQPTMPAQDTISLDSVFGETEPGPSLSGGSGPDSSRPAQPAAEEAGGAGFSFDEFFRPATPEGATGGGGGGGTTPRTSGRQDRPAADDGDADRFQAWLKKLKS